MTGVARQLAQGGRTLGGQFAGNQAGGPSGPPPMCPRRPQLGRRLRRGFSLVELSIVILTLSLLFTMIFGVFFGVAQITSSESPVSLAKQQALLALENMRSSINQTYYHSEIKRLVFVGRKQGSGDRRQDILTFAAVHPGAEVLGTPAVREVSFYFKENGRGDGTGTLMRREDQLVDKYPGTGGAHYPLLQNVLMFKLEYSLNGKDFKDDWHHEEFRRVPRLVRISLQAQIGGKVQRFETLSYVGLYMY